LPTQAPGSFLRSYATACQYSASMMYDNHVRAKTDATSFPVNPPPGARECPDVGIGDGSAAIT